MSTDDTTPRLLQQLRDQLTDFRSHVDKRLDGVDKRLDSIEVRMRLQQAGVESLGVDVQNTERAVAELAGLMGNIADTVESNTRRISTLEDARTD